MIHAIPNPTKTITVPVDVMTARQTVKNLNNTLTNLGMNGYRLTSADDFMGVYVFSKTELLSVGVNITITVMESNNNTQIHIEVARVIGSFDRSFEVTMANQHISNLLKAISIAMDPNADNRVDEERKKQEQLEKDSSTGTLIMFGMFIVFVLYLVS